MTQRATINDIAKKNGLSTTTVSRVLTGKAIKYRIGKDSQQKIIEAAKELNYIANQFAANLRTRRSNMIALIVPTLNNPLFARITTYKTRNRLNGYFTPNSC